MTAEGVDTDPVSAAAPSPAVGEVAVVGAVWGVRLFAGFTAAIGLGAAAAALTNILYTRATGAWLLPLAAGGLTALLGFWVSCEPADSTIAWRTLGRRVLAMALLVAYAFILLPFFGFLAASMLLVVALATLYASNPLFVAAGGLVIAVGMWALFWYVLAEPLPGGLLWR